MESIVIRRIESTDSLEELTDLLHLAYKQLADKGLYFKASNQTVKDTARRLKSATGLVAIHNNRIIGTICYYRPNRSRGHQWFNSKGVAKFGQFAVDPQWQKSGLGSLLVSRAEALARRDNARELAIDTAEGATSLINFYEKRGYRHVGFAQWKNVGDSAYSDHFISFQSDHLISGQSDHRFSHQSDHLI